MHQATSLSESYVPIGNLRVATSIYNLIVKDIAPGTGISPDNFFAGLEEIVKDLGPKNWNLLDKRRVLQDKIDEWHKARFGKVLDLGEYKTFLKDIGYLIDEGTSSLKSAQNVDPEIALLAGPQLVVPVDNARMAVNAANARWGSLYDAVYGSNIIPERAWLERGANYNPKRGEEVFRFSYGFLDDAAPLMGGLYEHVKQFKIVKNGGKNSLVAVMQNGLESALLDKEKFVGFVAGVGEEPNSIFLKNNGLHIEIQIDRTHPVGKNSRSGIKDIILESALTTIQDLEDSVCAVDASDKAKAYSNWNGLMKGDLTATFGRDGKNITRALNPERKYIGADGEEFSLPGRSLLLVRNVGIHLYTDAVRYFNPLTGIEESIPEGFLDAMVTSLAAMHDLKATGRPKNSKAGSIYIVKPKLHGPEEVSATDELFSRVEAALGLQKYTLKIGIMDEERRTSVNLGSCIEAAKERVIFINTGFLDRTGDEIKTSNYAGPMLPKELIKAADWLGKYELSNVEIGIKHGLMGSAQIGKGMWAKTDDLEGMLKQKIGHPKAGASTAWVPSPIAATIHAIHYHLVNVAEIQQGIQSRFDADYRSRIDGILNIPLLGNTVLSLDVIRNELENNAQGILGYVSKWVGQGIGCSKVPNREGVNLMEDLATLRISAIHIRNWLIHGIVTEKQVRDTMERMAGIVDRQNSNESFYHPMSINPNRSPEFQAALTLIFSNNQSPNGYTEDVLRKFRRGRKVMDMGPLV